MSAPSVASLFAGCGGLDSGFQETEFDLRFAADSDSAAVAVYRQNVHAAVHCLDVRSDDFHDEIANLGCVDVVLGGFPCQGFSKAGPKREHDDRNTLYLEMLAAVKVLAPSIFVAENVDGISQNFNGKYVRDIKQDFGDLGYTVHDRVVDAVEFGVPQHRRRMLFVGCRDGIEFSWPAPTRSARPRNGEFRIESHLELGQRDSTLGAPLTLRESISDLIELDQDLADHAVTNSWPAKYAAVFSAIGEGQKLCNVRHAPTSVYTWQIPRVFGRTTARERRILETIAKNRRHKRYGSIPNGNPIPPEIIAELAGLDPGKVHDDLLSLETRGFVKQKGSGFDLKGAMFCSGLFKRPRWDEPGPTVLTNFHNPRFFLHPSEDRPFSLRECARLQGFGDSFEFTTGDDGVSLVDGYRLVGNAVPPPLARALAESVMRALSPPKVVAGAQA